MSDGRLTICTCLNSADQDVSYSSWVVERGRPDKSTNADLEFIVQRPLRTTQRSIKLQRVPRAQREEAVKLSSKHGSERQNADSVRYE